MNLGAWKRLRSQMMSAAIDEMRLLHIFHFCQEAASPGVTWWDDLSKISIALHKSGVPPRPRLNWTLGCLEILEQKRGTCSNHCCYSISHCEAHLCRAANRAEVALSPPESGKDVAGLKLGSQMICQLT